MEVSQSRENAAQECSRDDVVVFLTDVTTGVEAEICRRWINSYTVEREMRCHRVIRLADSRGELNQRSLEQLARMLADDSGRLFFVPLRVLWLPRDHNGERRVRFRDLFLGDPRRPPAWRQRWLSERHPDRCMTIVADGAASPDLVVRYDRNTAGADSDSARAEFIFRQAFLALERAERRARGARYKVPRLVADLVLDKPQLVEELRELASNSGQEYADLRAEAADCLREMAADHSTLVLDLMVGVSRFLYRRGFDKQIQYLEEDAHRIRELSQNHTVVFLMTHKSYLDGCVMASLVYELDLPPLHLFGGMNMNFPGAGGFARRSGTIFIRRNFGDDAVYKLVIRHYIEYLIEKRFPLNWAFEGTRSRTGKLMPPRYGLLRYVADAAVSARQSSVLLVPVSISYDQLPDVSDYIAEQRGAEKKKESFGWLKRYVAALSRPHGRVHVRFGSQLPVLEDEDARAPLTDLQLQKRAFQVALEANRVTPVTASSLITFSLLARGDRAASFAELTASLADLAGLVRLWELPRTGDFDRHSREQLEALLDSLAANGVLTVYRDGSEPVYGVSAGAHTAAAYYRNSAVHFFVAPAIAELAMLAVAETEGENPQGRFREAALWLRNLLKFEFFFPDSQEFLTRLEAELEQRSPGALAALDGGGDAIHTALRSLRPPLAPGALRSFIDAYRVAAEVLVRAESPEGLDSKSFARDCKQMGQQLMLQRRIASEDSLNGVYFNNFFQFARNGDLLVVGNARRRELLMELNRVRRGIDYLAGLAETQASAGDAIAE